MPRPADVIKYFHEEPALLEPRTPDSDPDARGRAKRSEMPADEEIFQGDPFETKDAYRGYLAGTNHADDRVGLTTLRQPEAYATPVVEALGRDWWGRGRETGTVESVEPDGARRVLRSPGRTSVLVTASTMVDSKAVAAAAERAREQSLSALADLLDDAHVVFFPEPAHDGHDWSLWSATPLRDRLVAALRAHPMSGVRRFAIPYEDARSESKFYFDAWQLTETPLPDYVEEV